MSIRYSKSMLIDLVGLIIKIEKYYVNVNSRERKNPAFWEKGHKEKKIKRCGKKIDSEKM